MEGVRLPFHLLETARHQDDGDPEKKILKRAVHKLRTGVLIDGHPPHRKASTDSDESVTDVGSSEARASLDWPGPLFLAAVDTPVAFNRSLDMNAWRTQCVDQLAAVLDTPRKGAPNHVQVIEVVDAPPREEPAIARTQVAATAAVGGSTGAAPGLWP